MTDTPAPPALDRPEYHVWLADDTGEPVYVGAVTITNSDQLTGETQAKGLGINTGQPFHLTNLWIWAAMVRLELTRDKFGPFTKRLEYRPVDREEAAPAEPDPTFGAEAPSTGSD